jgi:hypothetical protein
VTPSSVPNVLNAHGTYLNRLLGVWPGLLVLLLGGPAATINMIASAADSQAPYTPRTFYVAAWGNDLNPGTNPRQPWRSVRHVNRVLLRPGDTVLFRGGDAFTDSALMPGSAGAFVSGTAARPVTFASYGRGQARITQGIFFAPSRQFRDGPSHLTFGNLALGPRSGVEGTGDWITLSGLHISDLMDPGTEVGIETMGSHWRIVGNQIDGTGDSGMLLGFGSSAPGEEAGGSDYLVQGNVISHTGLDPHITYGTHGIYAKVADATIRRNRISQFRDDGISVRYRNATVTDNYIADGSIGIGWFQYDTSPGTSRFLDNTIAHTSRAAIFVCGVLEQCRRPLESFVISGNRLQAPRGDVLNLQPTGGEYHLTKNLRQR